MTIKYRSTASSSHSAKTKALATLCLSTSLLISGQANAGFFDFLLPKKDDYTKTHYPIVLTHGLFGFNNIAGIDYWFGIPDALRKGGAQVFISEVSAENKNEVLGEQLIEQLDEWAALNNTDKFNLIGHSQGGGTIRYVAGVRPDLVASLTTIGASHKGSGVADAIDIVPDNPLIREPIAALVEVLGHAIHLLSGSQAKHPQDALGALESLTSKGAADFNRRFPLGMPKTDCGEGEYTANGMSFYSWTGSQPVTTLFIDPTDGGMFSGSVVNRLMGKGGSDGMAPVCGAHFGQVIRDNYRMNHMDEVNHILGLTSILESDPKTLYRQHANRLKLAGL